MANLSNILGGPWSPPREPEYDPPELQLADAMANAGLNPPPNIVIDGKLHRFNSGTKGKAGHDKSGWYLAFPDGVPAGSFGCWRSGIELNWRANVGRQLTVAEEMAHTRRIQEAKALRDAELKRQREVAADTAEKIWTEGSAASADHPYLVRKKVGTHGARVTGDGRLMVPLYNAEGNLSSIQYIDPDGGKLYHSGGQTGGCFWMVGTNDEPGTIYVAEGFATAATIHEAMGRPCVVAYSASNIVPVTGTIREQFGVNQDIVIVADHDGHGVGQKYADQAAAKYGARSILIPIPGDANDYVAEGHDLTALLLTKVDSDWLVPVDEFSSQPSPISWLVKHWIQDRALIMVHGPSGGGKTFVVLDWMLSIASTRTEWYGHKINHGPIVYLAGEGHHGLRARIAAWKHDRGIGHIEMWLSRHGCDLNTTEGYHKVLQAIRNLGVSPRAIVVDTLHRFLAGDENSAQDAKTMLDSCAALMEEFDCSVILVHHTGVSEEAQHRARGSSAWRGALDIEVSVVPAKNDNPLELVQRKSKDSELALPLYFNLRSVVIPGWLDEDGEPVTSAVIEQAEAPVKQEKESKLSVMQKLFSSGWYATGMEEIDSKPYVSKSALIHYLTTQKGFSEANAKQAIKPSVTNKLIGVLIVSDIIKPEGHGWVVIDPEMAQAMMLAKSGSGTSGTSRYQQPGTEEYY